MQIESPHKFSAFSKLLFALTIIISIIVVSYVAKSQELPPPPPLPRASAPKTQTIVKAPPPTSQPETVEISETSAREDVVIPDFGLFDPSGLPSNDTTDLQALADGLIEPNLVPEQDVAQENPNIPITSTPAVSKPDLLEDDSDLAELLESPDMSIEEAKPVNTSIAQNESIEKNEAESEQSASQPPKASEQKSKITAIEPPNLPSSKMQNQNLVDALPSWMNNEDLPSLRPLPQERDLGQNVLTDEEPIQDKNILNDDDNSIASLIDREIESGETYVEPAVSKVVSQNKVKTSSESKAKTASKEKVVWPRDFKTQTLPNEIYQKNYDKENSHLSHAIYKKEIEMHMFNAVRENDIDAIRALLRTGVPLTIRNINSEDLVIHAVKSGANASLQLLLALGASPNQQDRYGATPLHRAAFLGRNDLATILLRAGAKTSINDVSGLTPIAIAMARQDQLMLQTLGYFQSSQNGLNSIQAQLN